MHMKGSWGEAVEQEMTRRRVERVQSKAGAEDLRIVVRSDWTVRHHSEQSASLSRFLRWKLSFYLNNLNNEDEKDGAAGPLLSRHQIRKYLSSSGMLTSRV